MQGFNVSIALAIALSFLPLGALAVAGEYQGDQFSVIEKRLDLPVASSEAPISAVTFTHLDTAEGLTYSAIARQALKGDESGVSAEAAVAD